MRQFSNAIAASAAMALGLGSLLSYSGAAEAADYKVYNASACQPYGSTKATDLTIQADAVINKTTTKKTVICPAIVSDYPYGLSTTNPKSMYVFFSAGAYSGGVNCTFYYGSASEGRVSNYKSSGYQNPYVQNYIYMSLNAGPTTPSYGANPINLICEIGRSVRMHRIYVSETGDTSL